MVDDVVIENEESGKEFRFAVVEDLTDSLSRDVTSIPLPSNSSQDTVLFPLTGIEEDIEWSFILFDDGTDKSNGTSPSRIETLDEQREYLRNEIYTPGIDDTVLVKSQPYFDVTVVRGVLTRLTINMEGGKTTVLTGDATVKMGKIGLF